MKGLFTQSTNSLVKRNEKETNFTGSQSSFSKGRKFPLTAKVKWLKPFLGYYAQGRRKSY